MGKVLFSFCLHADRDRQLVARLRSLAVERRLSAEIRAALEAYYGAPREISSAEVLRELREIKALLAGAVISPADGGEQQRPAELPAEVRDKLRGLGL